MATIQIPEKLFFDVCRYFAISPDTSPEADRIRRELLEKVDRMANRELYSKSKTAPTPEEREQARKEYLDRKGIPEDFRW